MHNDWHNIYFDWTLCGRQLQLISSNLPSDPAPSHTKYCFKCWNQTFEDEPGDVMLSNNSPRVHFLTFGKGISDFYELNFETEVAIGVREKCDPGLKSKWTQTQSIEGGPKRRACLFACTFSFNHGSWSLLQFSFGCGWWSRHTANPPWILGTLTSGVR